MFSTDTVHRITRFAEDKKIEPAALLAIVEVESAGKACAMVEGRKEPLIRFEGHYLDRRLSPEERIAARAAGLASANPGAIHNPPSQLARWRLLERAAAIDRKAAYESVSWGVGQVMGAHWAWLGYPSFEALVEEARSGLEGQLSLMLCYIDKSGLSDALRRHDWTAFARGYNGPGFARNGYHLKLSLAYRRNARRVAMGETHVSSQERNLLKFGDRGEYVRRLQRQLSAIGHPVAVDGVFGPETQKAVEQLQRRHGLVPDGIFGPKTQLITKASLPTVSVADALRRSLDRLCRWILRLLVRWKV
ncbi:N-acetylmuramidase domain-containing protein [Chelativorans sp. YIM 93263]|uniref:N-acetylmuramidase domain-containing protein n=1 Tax=Chelativorans sp. YIM 93263 TaxID=2906648 RepID=UPI00237892B8|nr:N-acetylmuramidase domain-containing protein [Chelativorans sp. YIM 93263]